MRHGTTLPELLLVLVVVGVLGSIAVIRVSALRDRLPTLLRNAKRPELAAEIEQTGWDTSVLAEVEKAATAALKPREDDVIRAREGMDWMYRWKEVHPQCAQGFGEKDMRRA